MRNRSHFPTVGSGSNAADELVLQVLSSKPAERGGGPFAHGVRQCARSPELVLQTLQSERDTQKRGIGYLEE